MFVVSEDSEFARQTPMTASFSGGELDSEKKKQKKAKNGGILGLFRLAFDFLSMCFSILRNSCYKHELSSSLKK